MLVIWNPNAGSVRSAEEIRRQLVNRDCTEVHETKTAEEAIKLVSSHIANGEEQVVAAGGDGTVNALINGMMRNPENAELGVLPLGTANDWCSSLGVPDDLREALALHNMTE